MVTIGDVARAAGVAPSTVSYVLSGKRSISPDTRRRVERSIEELGYRPHAGARALASSRTNVVALAVPLRADVDVGVVMRFATSVVTTARRYDHDVLLLTADEGPAGLERVARTAMVDALIVMDVENDDPRLPVLMQLRQPSVLIGLPRRPEGCSCVDLDFAAVGRHCVGHLVSHGHRRVALIGPTPAVYRRGTTYARRLLAGFNEAARQQRLEVVAEPCEPSYDGVSACLDRIEARLPGCTGLVVHNEAALAPLLTALRARGRSVPADISIVTVCPREVALSLSIRLTSVDIPADEVGLVAVEMVMHQLADRRRPEIRLLAPLLTERESCAPPALG